MNILNIEHISKIYGDKVIFDDISYGIHEGDKIGIIGINGTGKTTLLRMIAGTEEPDEGQIIRQNGLKITFLTQHPEFPKDATVLAHVEESIDGADWEVKKDARDILTRLGLTCFEEKIEHLSGGQKKRIALAKALGYLKCICIFILAVLPFYHLCICLIFLPVIMFMQKTIRKDIKIMMTTQTPAVV